ncbi:MAG: hypothetical protein KatS3mg110_3197 [Pirellulaceae bacterium]|nr:MAG: hypothetical protein KatS3mg110_3197 [Pirellulaceae bacterium]
MKYMNTRRPSQCEPQGGATITVCAIGLPNSGKSALLAVLTGNTDKFRSGPAPGTTAVITRYESDGVLWLDTPGLDNGFESDRKVIEEVYRADLILWCHSLRMGELHRTEVSFLQSLLDHGVASRNVSIALTHCADGVSYRDRCRIVTVIRNQMRQMYDTFWPPESYPKTCGACKWGRLYRVELAYLKKGWNATWLAWPGQEIRRLTRHVRRLRSLAFRALRNGHPQGVGLAR